MNIVRNQTKGINKGQLKVIGCFTAVFIMFSLVLLGCSNRPCDPDVCSPGMECSACSE
ncbi:MAG: hypothetical protein ACREOW_12135 [Thermodesulfobacteriota bacterium]